MGNTYISGGTAISKDDKPESLGKMLEEVYVTDSTAIINGFLRRGVVEGIIKGKVLLHIALIRVFEEMARSDKSAGYIGLEELRLLRREVERARGVEIEVVKELPEGYRAYSFRDLGEVDAMLRELALEWNAILVTCDEVQAKAAEAMGVRVLLSKKYNSMLASFEKFFEEDVMSVHLKEGVVPLCKRGLPGNWKMVPLSDKPLMKEEVEKIEREIIERSRVSKDAFIEAERPGSTIIQLNHYRIVIARPPFSDGLEITIVKPIAQLRLEDYRLPKKLIERFEKKAEGILIAGAPGMGKTTFAQALADYYHRKGKIVKTMESPRDMQLPPEVTQYSKSFATSEEIHDVLLLSRPDYTVFDEMRDTRDFELYADLRLAGVGMIGVVHAASPIDAIQRFVGRVELGMIPSIVDTVIFIKNGTVEKVYELETVVKIPHGLREADLARPVVVVKDFMTGEPEYELYVFGERTFVVPVRKTTRGRGGKARFSLEKALSKYIPPEDFEVMIGDNGEALVLIAPEYLSSLSNKLLKRLKRIGRKLGVELTIRPRV